MHTPTFISSFRPPFTHSPSIPSQHHSTPHTPPARKFITTPIARTQPSAPFSALAATLTALSLLFPSPPAKAQPTTPVPTPVHSHLDSYRSPQPTHGTLLRLQPSPPRHSPPRSSPDTTPNSPSHNPASYPTPSATLPELAPPATLRPQISSIRLLRLRLRARSAAIGLVGVGALTSGSVFFRRSNRSSQSRRASPRGLRDDPSHCAVICMHIPFCVPERTQLLTGLTHLADNSCLVNSRGMACATRAAAALLLQESGLLEDSSKFAPDMELFLADHIGEAERRFNAHVEIEATRVDRMIARKMEVDVSSRASLGEYGVVTLVVATTGRVDLGCYDEERAVVERLRGALDCLGRVKPGAVAGMELMWVPEGSDVRSLTRAQMTETFPTLRVLY